MASGWVENGSSLSASSATRAIAASRRHALILGGHRIAVAEVRDAWLAPDYRYFKLSGVDSNTYLVRHDERANTWELTMFRAKHADG